MKKMSLLRVMVIVSMSCLNITMVQAKNLDKVTVEQGVLQGKTVNNLTVFKGIPFAKPPIGEGRWRAPEPAEKWQGIRSALEFAPSPIQGGRQPSEISEDCLYLNIWSPAQSADEKLPVLVWIYGGGFSFGSSSDPVTEGTNLANKGVILVTIAYRVGQLGFLAHPELSAENPNKVSGNYGLLDQIAALKWVKNNITAFGGNPDNVTIFGESAGAISVSMLAASPLAKGLFHKAISQSGGSFGPTRSPNYPGENMNTLITAEAQGIDYVKQFGASSIADLRKMNAQKFIPAGWSMAGGWPIVDGYVIPDDQFTLYEQGQFNDTPILVGYNSDEGISFMWNTNKDQFMQDLNTRFGKFAPSLSNAYSVSNEDITRSARNLIRDAAFGWHSWSWARLQSKKGSSAAYLYFFDQHPEYPKDSPKFGNGSPHGQDVAYVFEHLDMNNPDTTKTDIAISKAMATYWTNFAKNGDPNSKDVPTWPAFNSATKQVMHFQQQPKIGAVPDENGLEVLDQYFEWRRTAEGKNWAAGNN